MFGSMLMGILATEEVSYTQKGKLEHFWTYSQNWLLDRARLDSFLLKTGL